MDLDNLKQHCLQYGAEFSQIDIKFESDIVGNVVTAANNIKKEEILMRIPYNICISAPLVASYTPLARIFEDNPGILSYPDEVLAIGLMYASVSGDSQCPWYHHVKMLPTTFNTPLYWDTAEIEELKPSNVYHLTNMLLKQIQSDWQSIHEPLSQAYDDLLGNITYDHYKWALSVVYSRAVGIQRQGEYTRVIPPLLDMANHNPHLGSHTSQTINYDDMSDSVILISSQDTNKGEEVCVVYGPYPNAKLLYSYGFVIADNPHKAIDVWSRVEKSSYQAATKQQLLQSHAMTKNQSYDFTGTIRKRYVSPSLLATIRIIQICDEDELAVASNAFEGKMISVRNEVASYTALRGLCVLRMQVEKAEDDKRQLGEMLLSGVPTNDRRLISLIVRVDERELLQEILSFINEGLSDLEQEGDHFIPLDHQTRSA